MLMDYELVIKRAVGSGLRMNRRIFCLQETKLIQSNCRMKSEIPRLLFYFDHSKLKKGYSGGGFCQDETEKVEYGMGIEEFDQEGRL